MADDVAAQWEHAAAAVLRRSGRLGEDDPDSAVVGRLTRRTLDGIPVAPLGTPETVADLPDPGMPGAPPFVRGSDVRRADLGWDVRVQLADPDVARSAEHVLADLENGATSVWVRLGSGAIPVEALGEVLRGVYLDLAPVVLDCPDDPDGAARTLVGLASDAGVRLAAGSVLSADPVAPAWTDHHDGDPGVTLLEVFALVADLAVEAGPGVRATVVDGTVVHDSGASEVVELAYLLAAGTTCLRTLVEAGRSPDEAAGLLEFRLAATDEQLPTIAKLRAARLLWNRVGEVCGVSPSARGMVQHAVTSAPMTTRFDPWVNLLRGTVAAFAAGVGGASAVTVLPFDHAIGRPDAFSRRISRNTSSLLIQEAHVAVVTDPAGGSYAVERLTADLASAAWRLFQRVEAAGGILGGGMPVLAEAVEAVVADRDRLVARRRQAITGVSEFPLLHEVLPRREPFPDDAPRVRSYAHAFEAMRAEPAAQSVLLATMGSVAQHTARATFIANLLAAGGIDTVTAGATAGVDDVLTAYDGEAVVCLAGPDSAYDEWGADLAAALRKAGATTVLVAGKPAEWADDNAALGDDALAFLERTRAALSASSVTRQPIPTQGADR